MNLSEVESYLKKNGSNIDSVVCYLMGIPSVGSELKFSKHFETIRDVELVAFKVVYLWDQICNYKFEDVDEEQLKSQIHEFMKENYLWSDDDEEEEEILSAG